MSKNVKIHRKSRSGHRGGTLLGIFLGLVLGALVAFGIAFYINKAPMPFQDKVGHNGEPRPGDKPAARPGSVSEPLALPGKPGDKPVEKPRFDFYKILPGGEQGAAPGADAPPPAVAPSTAPVAPTAAQGTAPAPTTEPMYLQVGAFQEPADADNLKARLALVGIEASVQQVIMADKGTLHRVRIGPFSKPEDIARLRSQLAQNGIQANVVKAGPGH